MDHFFDGKVKLEKIKKHCELTEKCLVQNRIERPRMGSYFGT